MKEFYIGKEYVFYESDEKPRTMVLEKRPCYVKCKKSQIAKLKKELAEGNVQTLFFMDILLQEETYKHWKVEEIDEPIHT